MTINAFKTVGRLKRFCAVIVGAVFLMAGLFKLLDPVGAGLVMEEYFRFFHLGFLMPAAKGSGVAFALMESFLGAALISGIARRLIASLTFIVLGFFMVLTLILAIANPSMDCGCFGEVIHLSHLQTFLKNVVLMALSLFAFLPFRSLGTNKMRKEFSFGIAVVSLIAFAVYSWMGIPLVDYTEYEPGCEVLASMKGEAREEYTSMLIYEKDGQEGAFTLDRLPDSTWTFVRAETMHLERFDTETSVPNLTVVSPDGEYVDELVASGNVLLVSAYSPEKIKGEVWTRIAGAVDGASAAGFLPLVVVASTREAMDSLGTMTPDVRSRLEGHIFFSDRKILLSLNRSNGGATWFNDGQLIRKFKCASLPDGDEMLALTGRDPAEEMLRAGTKGRLHFETFALYLLAILLLL